MGLCGGALIWQWTIESVFIWGFFVDPMLLLFINKRYMLKYSCSNCYIFFEVSQSE